jgi:hypothetical protein
MKKYLLLVFALCTGLTAFAQMATTYRQGSHGENRLVSADERNICFRSRAKKLYADLDPSTHNQTNLNENPDNPVQISYQENGFRMNILYSNFHGFTEVLDGVDYPRDANASYSYNDGVGTFSYNYCRVGNAAINLIDGLNNVNLNDYENFVIRTLDVSSPLDGQIVNIKDGANTHPVAQGSRYCLQFCDVNNNVIRQIYIYSNDVKVVHLKEFFSPTQISNIKSVFLSTAGGDTNLSGSVSVAEAYFISAYDMNNEDYFKDMDDSYIGNAYIHPSYFICSNGVTLDEATGVLNVPGTSYKKASLNEDMYFTWNGVGADATSTGEGNCENEFGNSASNIYGNSSVPANQYADLSEYEEMTIVVSEGTPRLLLNRPTDNEQSNYVNIPNNPTQAAKYIKSSEDGKFVYDLAAIKADYGYVHLNAIKGANWQNCNITSVEVLRRNSLKSPAKILLSVPFEGFDMSDITVVTFDNEEDGDCIWRNVYGYLDYDKQGRVHKGTNDDIYLAGGDENPHDVRTLYVSRYNADFAADLLDNTYISKINNIYWETNFAATDNPIGTMTVNDICFTKNHVVVRNGGNHTLLGADLFKKYVNGEATNDNPGFGTNIGNAGSDGFVYGNSSVVWNCYADLGQFYKMQIKGNPDNVLRFVINRGEPDGTGDNNGAQVVAGGVNEVLVRLDSKGLAVVDIADIVKKRGSFHLNSIKGGNGSSVHVDYIKLFAQEDGVVEFNQDLYHTWNRAENGTVTRKDAFGGAFVNRIDGSTTINAGDAIFGDQYTFYKEDYAELTGYKAIKVTGTPGMEVRVLFNCTRNKINDGQGDNNCILQEKTITIDANGEGVLEGINNYVYFHLHGMKAGWGSASGTISKIELISDERVDYVLEGNGTLSQKAADVLAYDNGGKNANIGTCAMDAINDVGARVIDARPRVSISRTSLAYPANPNCLFLMRENLSRKQHSRVQFDTPSTTTLNGVTLDARIYANMVKIGGLPSDPDTNNDRSASFTITSFKIDNLHLFDGYSFSAPRKLNADAARLTRKTTADVVGTLILPFAASNIPGDAYDTFASKYAQYDVKQQGILNDIDIKKGDHVLLFEKHSGDVEAYWPYLFVANSTSDNTEIFGSSVIEQTPEVGTDDAPGEYMTNEAAANEAGQRHYLRGFMESTHVENAYGYNSSGKLLHAANATVAPFRVMIQSPQNINDDIQNNITNGEVKVVRGSFLDDDDTPTAIENIEGVNAESIVDVYSIGGAQIMKNVKAADALRNLPKGVYVVGGNKVVK